jgi:hypothetical protein
MSMTRDGGDYNCGQELRGMCMNEAAAEEGWRSPPLENIRTAKHRHI